MCTDYGLIAIRTRGKKTCIFPSIETYHVLFLFIFVWRGRSFDYVERWPQFQPPLDQTPHSHFNITKYWYGPSSFDGVYLWATNGFDWAIWWSRPTQGCWLILCWACFSDLDWLIFLEELSNAGKTQWLTNLWNGRCNGVHK